MLDLHPDWREDVDLLDVSESLLLDRSLAVLVARGDCDPTGRFSNDLHHLEWTAIRLPMVEVFVPRVAEVVQIVGQQASVDFLLNLDA